MRMAAALLPPTRSVMAEWKIYTGRPALGRRQSPCSDHRDHSSRRSERLLFKFVLYRGAMALQIQKGGTGGLIFVKGVLSSRLGRRTHSALRTLRSVPQRPARPCNALVRYARHTIRGEAHARCAEFLAPYSVRDGVHQRYRT